MSITIEQLALFVPAEGLTTVEVCRLTGASYRQVDYWCRCGLIDGQPGYGGPGVGSGHRRCWTERQVRRVQALTAAAAIKATPLDVLAEQIAAA